MVMTGMGRTAVLVMMAFVSPSITIRRRMHRSRVTGRRRTTTTTTISWWTVGRRRV
jgi:hypothetical protein